MKLLLEDKRIFYIEDDLKNRSIVQTILEHAGAAFSFERWGNVDDALRRLHNFAPVDLILLDLMFDGKVTGYDIFKAIRADTAFATIPIIAVSASDASIEIPKTRALGFSGFIGKPIEMRKFPDQLLKVMNGEAVWEASY